MECTIRPTIFYPVSAQEIADAEARLGFQFPSQLKLFFNEVGCGFYKIGTADAARNPSIINAILSPGEIADIVCEGKYPVLPSEGFVSGVLPFFDCGSGTFLVMKPLSDQPNAVYWPSGLESQRVSKDLEEFFNRLYERADFYRRDVLEWSQEPGRSSRH